jgi:hypothetical protein
MALGILSASCDLQFEEGNLMLNNQALSLTKLYRYQQSN